MPSDVVARSAARIKNRSIDIFHENTGETPDSQGLVDNKCAHRVDLDMENAYYGVPFSWLSFAEIFPEEFRGCSARRRSI